MLVAWIGVTMIYVAVLCRMVQFSAVGFSSIWNDLRPVPLWGGWGPEACFSPLLYAPLPLGLSSGHSSFPPTQQITQLSLAFAVLCPWNSRSPSFHLARFPCKSIRKTPSIQRWPLLLLWMSRRACYEKWSQPSHSWEYTLPLGMLLWLSGRLGSLSPLSIAQELTPTSMWVPSMPELSVMCHIPLHLPVPKKPFSDLFLSKMPNIQERRSESASCWVKTAPSSCLLSSGADC